MNWDELIEEWRQEAQAEGFLVEELLERGGFPILACSKGGEDLPLIYLSSGVHGDEPAGPQALLSLLKSGFFDERFRWLICPALNPTGLEAGTRETADGIDLNRDYFTAEAAETCAHLGWLERQGRPLLFLSLHEDWESTGFYYYEINTGVEAPAYEDLLAAVAPFFPPEPEEEIDEHPVTQPGWIFHPDHPDIPEGWPEAIYLSRQGCPLSLTFETPSSASLAERIGCHEAAVRCAVEKLASSAGLT